MIRFACPACGKRFNVADDKGGAKATCTCGQRVQVPATGRKKTVLAMFLPAKTLHLAATDEDKAHDTVSQEAAATSVPSTASNQQSSLGWYYTSEGKGKSGPVSSAKLQALAKSGNLQPTDMVWKQGMAKWVPASQIKGLFATAASATTGKKTGTPSPLHSTQSGQPSTRSTGSQAPMSSDEASEPVRRSKAVLAVAGIALAACIAGAVVFFQPELLDHVRLQQPATKNEGAAPPVQVAQGPVEKSGKPGPNDKSEKKPAVEEPTDTATNKKTPEEQPGPSETKQPPTEQPKDIGTKEKEAPPEPPQRKTELSKEPVKDKEPTEAKALAPTQAKLGAFDFSKVDYSYDFSKVDYTQGPEGQPLVERKGEENQPATDKNIVRPTSIRFVEQGLLIDKAPSPDVVIDTARRLEREWAARYPQACDIFLKRRFPKVPSLDLKRYKTLLEKGQLPGDPMLPPVPLKPGVTGFRYLTKADAVLEAAVIKEQQKAILFLADGQQVPGDLHLLSSDEVQFKSAKAGAKVTTYEASKVKAVQTPANTFFYSTERKQFVGLGTLLTMGGDEVSFKDKVKAHLVLSSGQHALGELLGVNSTKLLLVPYLPKAKPLIFQAAEVKAVFTDSDSYFYVADKKRFVSLKSLLKNANQKDTQLLEEEKANAWMELRSGKMPDHFEFLADGKPVDMSKTFFRHGRRKGEYVLKDEVRLAYEDYWFNGIAHGSALRYYPDGKKFEGVWVNGKLHGISKDFHENGKVSAEYPHIHGIKHGTEKTFHLNGQVKSEGSYVKGNAVGWHKGWRQDGTREYETFFDSNGVAAEWYCTVDGKKHGPITPAQLQGFAAAGKLEGLATRWHIKGPLAEEGHFQAGKKEGMWTSWWNLTGAKKEEGSYQADKKLGVWTRWYIDGKKAEVQTYLNGVLHGGEVQYNRYKEGQVISTCQWVNGQRHGKEVHYSQFTGQVEEIIEWVNGQRVP